MVSKVITFFMDQPDFKTFQNFFVFLYPIILHRAKCLYSAFFFARSTLSNEYSARHTQIGNKSKAFLEKLPINSRVSSVRWALQAPLNFKFPNSQQKGVILRACRPYDVSQVSWQTRMLALESISRVMISSIRYLFIPNNFVLFDWIINFYYVKRQSKSFLGAIKIKIFLKFLL